MEVVRIGFLGAGVMATALIDGIVRSGLINPNRVIASDPFGASREKIIARGARATEDNTEVILNSDVIIIATKPDIVSIALKDVSSKVDHAEFSSKAFISIAAGVTLSTLESYLPPNTKSIIRVMPNTPCLVGESAAAYCTGTRCDEADKAICRSIFGSVGTISEVPEKLMDAVTGLSGSGPAYVFLLIEALADGGVRAGLPRQVAMQLAAQTVKGAAAMCLETGKHPAELKDQVCSPGGTTIAGVQALEEHGFRAAAIAAVVAASNRASELSKK